MINDISTKIYAYQKGTVTVSLGLHSTAARWEKPLAAVSNTFAWQSTANDCNIVIDSSVNTCTLHLLDSLHTSASALPTSILCTVAVPWLEEESSKEDSLGACSVMNNTLIPVLLLLYSLPLESIRRLASITLRIASNYDNRQWYFNNEKQEYKYVYIKTSVSCKTINK